MLKAWNSIFCILTHYEICQYSQDLIGFLWRTSYSWFHLSLLSLPFLKITEISFSSHLSILFEMVPDDEKYYDPIIIDVINLYCWPYSDDPISPEWNLNIEYTLISSFCFSRGKPDLLVLPEALFTLGHGKGFPMWICVPS